MKTKLLVSLAISILLSSLTPQISTASRGGQEDKANPFAIGFPYDDSGIPSVCSGTLISPTIIATAGHCVVNSGGVFGKNYVFAPPGIAIDTPLQNLGVQPKITKFITKENLKISGGNELDDIAFIVLDSPIKSTKFIKIASEGDISNLREDSTVDGYGFGFVYETSKAYSSFARKYPLSWKSILRISNSLGTVEITSPTAVACRGDSGGSITVTSGNGDQILIGVMSGAASTVNACGTMGADGLYRMRITLIYPFLELLAGIYNPNQLIPAPTATKKTIKITCFKGKLKKVVSGTNPKCPKGYTLKK